MEIKEKLPKIYSKELIDLLFYEFYTKITYIENGLSVTRKTAANYLDFKGFRGLQLNIDARVTFPKTSFGDFLFEWV